MANSLTGWSTFVPQTRIKSAEVNANFEALRDQTPVLQKFTVSYTSFQALGATVTGAVTLVSLGASEIIHGTIVKHSAAVSGTSITAGIVRVGKTGTDDFYSDDFDVFQSATASAAQKTRGLDAQFSSTSMILTLSLTGGLLSQLSAGSIDVYVQKSTLP